MNESHSGRAAVGVPANHPLEGPENLSFRALSERLEFTVRCHSFNKDSLSLCGRAAVGVRDSRARDNGGVRDSPALLHQGRCLLPHVLLALRPGPVRGLFVLGSVKRLRSRPQSLVFVKNNVDFWR